MLFQVGVWVNSSDYKNASPDPLRNCAEKLVDEINTNNAEDVHRFCNIYADLNLQVSIQPHFSMQFVFNILIDSKLTLRLGLSFNF